jgi:hypothetical protein
LVVALSLLASGCSNNGPDVPTSDVVASIPWPRSESLSYVLKDEKGNTVGQGSLSIDASGGDTLLSQSFKSSQSTDESAVRVDSRTLKPVSATRKIVAPNDAEEISVTYSQEGALIRQGEKQSGLSVPEHAYDNDSSLFLWRTLKFEPGFKTAYVTVITNRRDRHEVQVTVVGKENVSVPAGSFQAWRLEIETSNARQVAWYADTATRPLLRYDNDRGLFFELERMP